MSELFSIIALIFVVVLHQRVGRLERQMRSGAIMQLAEGTAIAPATPALPHIPQELAGYIQERVAAGVTDHDMLPALLQAGWKEEVITQALSRARRGTEVSTPMPAHIASAKQTLEPTSGDVLLKWLSEDWLMKMGALLVIIGVGWFVTYAFMHNWIGPAGRITIGLLFGLVVMLLGEWRIRAFKNQGAVLLALGAGIVLLTIFAAQTFYHFFTPALGLGISFLSVVFIALSSVRHNSKSLAALALVLASISPVLAGYSQNDVIWLFSYLFVVALGALLVAAFTGWRFLAPTSLAFVALYFLSTSNSFTYRAESGITILLMFSFAFSFLYYVANIIAILKSDHAEQADLLTAGANGLLLLLWVSIAAPDVWKSSIIAVLALIFAAGAFTIFQTHKRSEPIFIYSGIAILMLGVATAMELHGAALTIAYILEAGLLTLGTAILGDNSAIRKVSLLFIIPIVLSLSSIVTNSWRTGIFHSDFAVLFLLVVVLTVLGIFFSSRADAGNVEAEQSAVSTSFTGAGIYALVLTWLILHSPVIMGYSTGTMVSLFIYTILGITLYFKGKGIEKSPFKTAGIFLLGGVLARLFLVDIWEMPLEGRIITFVVIGILLISTAFLGRSTKQIQ